MLLLINLLQAALADFLSEGHFASHVRRMRPIHAERQDTRVGMLRDRLWDRLTCAPLDASMQFPAFLAPDADDRAVARSLAEAGVVVSPLSTYYLGECPHPGLLLGYAGIDEAAAHELGPDAVGLNTGEEGVVRRFGKWVRTESSGLNFKFPYPIEKVDLPKVTQVKEISVGRILKEAKTLWSNGLRDKIK